MGPGEAILTTASSAVTVVVTLVVVHLPSYWLEPVLAVLREPQTVVLILVVWLVLVCSSAWCVVSHLRERRGGGESASQCQCCGARQEKY